MNIKTWAKNVSEKNKETSLPALYNKLSKPLKVTAIIITLLIGYAVGSVVGLIVAALIAVYTIYRSKK